MAEPTKEELLARIAALKARLGSAASARIRGGRLNPCDAEMLNGGIDPIRRRMVRTESEALAVVRQFIEKRNEQ